MPPVNNTVLGHPAPAPLPPVPAHRPSQADDGISLACGPTAE